VRLCRCWQPGQGAATGLAVEDEVYDLLRFQTFVGRFFRFAFAMQVSDIERIVGLGDLA
jgi:hypothetical protein